jgi:uncharacterized protein (TIGR03083 family)
MGVVQGDAVAPTVDFVTAFAAAAAELVATVPSCDLGARVPACPRWSSYDLLVHLGNVHAWAATIVETGRPAPEQNDEPSSRRARTVAQWYAGKAEDLLQVLRTAGNGPCWTLSTRHRTKSFWPRRQAHETWVHLVDLQQAQGRTTDIPARLAADGVGEVLDVFLPRMHARGRRAVLSDPLLLHAGDTRDTWLITPRLDGPPEGHRVEDTELVDAGIDLVTATAADLMLLLWKRISPDHPTVTLDGDRGRLLAFLRSPLTP